MTPIENLYNGYLVLSGQIFLLFMLLPVILAVWRRQYLTKALKLFFWYCFFTLFFNVFEQAFIWAVRSPNFQGVILPYLTKWGIKNTNFTSIFYFTKDFIFLSLFFNEVLRGYINTKWVKPLAYFLVITTWIDYLFIEGFKVAGVYNSTIDAIFCFFIPCLFLWHIFNEDSKVPLSKNSFFWIGLGLISTSLIGFFLFFAGDKIRAMDKVFFFKLSILKNGVMMAEQILEAIGFYYAPYTRYMRRKTE